MFLWQRPWCCLKLFGRDGREKTHPIRNEVRRQGPESSLADLCLSSELLFSRPRGIQLHELRSQPSSRAGTTSPRSARQSNAAQRFADFAEDRGAPNLVVARMAFGQSWR